LPKDPATAKTTCLTWFERFGGFGNNWSGVMRILRRGVRQRLLHCYRCEQLPGTLMRHAKALAQAIGPLPVGVIETPLRTQLQSSPGFADASLACRRTACLRAVAIPAVAGPTQEEDLTAARPGTNHVANLVHVRQINAENWTITPERETKGMSVTASGGPGP
jgi:hypothetical protein